jgi:hypothetical protein
VDVEQHGAGIPQQPVGPARNHEATDDPHRWISPYPLRIHRHEQCRDRKDRGCGIGHHVDIGGSQIVVVMMMAMGVNMVMAVAMTMLMGVVIAQQPGTDYVDDESERGHRNRLAIGNLHRMEQPDRALIGNLNSDHDQDDRAGEGGEVTELAGAEGEIRITGLPTGEQIGKRCDSESGGVCRHVPAIRQQSH